jgi:hypothetical protein
MKRLKRGTTLFHSTRSENYRCGTPRQQITISPIQYSELVTLTLGGRLTESTMALLDRAGLLDDHIGKIELTQRYSTRAESTDAAFSQLRARITPELSQTTWVAGVRDGGVTILTARQNFLIEISGNNRVATLLYSLLLASGFTHTRLSFESKNSHPRIVDSEIGVAGITPSDIGSLRSKRETQLRHDISLFHIDKSIDYNDELSTPDLLVHCGDIDPHRYAQWMADGHNFLHIPHPIADTAQIGPLVIPGKSPCIRCAELTQAERLGIHGKDLLPTNESELVDYPIIAAHGVAAIAASLITQFFDGNYKKEVAGKVIFFNYQSPATSHEVAIARHPLCGCAFH